MGCESSRYHSFTTLLQKKESAMETVSLWKSDIRAIRSCVLADMENEGIVITPDTVTGVEYALRESALTQVW
jgi:hypothetical protein